MGISLQTYFENFDYNSQNVLSNNNVLLVGKKNNSLLAMDFINMLLLLILKLIYKHLNQLKLS